MSLQHGSSYGDDDDSSDDGDNEEDSEDYEEDSEDSDHSATEVGLAAPLWHYCVVGRSKLWFDALLWESSNANGLVVLRSTRPAERRLMLPPNQATRDVRLSRIATAQPMLLH